MGILAFRSGTSLPKLEHLGMSRSHDLSDLRFLAQCPSLRSLSFDIFGNHDGNPILDIPVLRNLKELTIKNTRHNTNRIFISLHEIRRSHQYQRLDFFHLQKFAALERINLGLMVMSVRQFISSSPWKCAASDELCNMVDINRRGIGMLRAQGITERLYGYCGTF
jgi:hypothetical protein